ncbi:phage holin, lambda family, partial [Salmonella enterica subsp. enterica]|nr:phage holin, lambda family [Salmonella enterica subsp. enterica]
MSSNPHTWSDWLELIKAWLQGDIPLDSL